MQQRIQLLCTLPFSKVNFSVWKTARMQIGGLNQVHIWYIVFKYEEKKSILLIFYYN